LLNAFYSGDIVGNLGSNTAVFSGNLGINSTSLALGPSTPFSFSLTSINPAPAIGPKGDLTDFTADFSGQLNPVPEPSITTFLTLISLTLTRIRK
jgi:hypothetical protein